MIVEIGPQRGRHALAAALALTGMAQPLLGSSTAAPDLNLPPEPKPAKVRAGGSLLAMMRRLGA